MVLLQSASLTSEKRSVPATGSSHAVVGEGNTGMADDVRNSRRCHCRQPLAHARMNSSSCRVRAWLAPPAAGNNRTSEYHAHAYAVAATEPRSIIAVVFLAVQQEPKKNAITAVFLGLQRLSLVDVHVRRPARPRHRCCSAFAAASKDTSFCWQSAIWQWTMVTEQSFRGWTAGQFRPAASSIPSDYRDSLTVVHICCIDKSVKL